MAATLTVGSRRVLRYSPWDAVLIGLSFAYAALLLSAPSIPLIGIGLWWTANTVAHNFIHTPFFRSRALNRAYSLFLSALMGIPQSLWRDRHLRHHRAQHGAGRADSRRSRSPGVDAAMSRSRRAWSWRCGPRRRRPIRRSSWASTCPDTSRGSASVLCRGTSSTPAARPATTAGCTTGASSTTATTPSITSGRASTGRDCRRIRCAGARSSRWPPVLRWLDAFSLESLERRVLRSPRLQRFVLSAHERAFRALLPRLPPIHRVTIVGGGLYPAERADPAAAAARRDSHDRRREAGAPRDRLDVPAGRRRARASAVRPGGSRTRRPRRDSAGVHRRSRTGLPAPAREAGPGARLDVEAARQGARVSWLLLKRLNLVTR